MEVGKVLSQCLGGAITMSGRCYHNVWEVLMIGLVYSETKVGEK